MHCKRAAMVAVFRMLLFYFDVDNPQCLLATQENILSLQIANARFVYVF
jgi:hypothetical protein